MEEIFGDFRHFVQPIFAVTFFILALIYVLRPPLSVWAQHQQKYKRIVGFLLGMNILFILGVVGLYFYHQT